jgi:polysaccharide export outer membrane protein
MRKIVISALATLALWGCVGPPDLPPIENTAAANYRLDTGDQLRVIVYGDDRLTGDYGVDDAGTISVPLIGHVQARGQTTAELEKSIKDRLAQGFLMTPSVAIQVQSYRPYFVLGEVKQPGQYPSIGDMTVNAAVAAAGGFTYRANVDTMTITRQSGDKVVKGTADGDTKMQPGDVVYVYERIF